MIGPQTHNKPCYRVPLTFAMYAMKYNVRPGQPGVETILEGLTSLLALKVGLRGSLRCHKTIA